MERIYANMEASDENKFTDPFPTVGAVAVTLKQLLESTTTGFHW